ncbi:prepilin-type N-terminal cleavage/methylation domain-containing protein [Candidatus Sumerlaeota bacterium]|nr:prepilin-type N-terminal cleavage/methylation domain-containing protein [Candidatus Sumerlaeota bacterium]
MNHRKAFTLIELLIVVAIIAILAAIAVPNFLEAQTRAKVSRARADLRSMATAVEAYRIDWNAYPADEVRDPIISGSSLSAADGFFPAELSTPTAYVTNARPPDPFVEMGGPNSGAEPIYLTLFYQNVDASIAAAGGDTDAYEGQLLSAGQIQNAKIAQGWATAPWDRHYGLWKMGSIGPDRDYTGGANMYDPTNGTISAGDIYRTQLRTEGGRQGVD